MVFSIAHLFARQISDVVRRNLILVTLDNWLTDKMLVKLIRFTHLFVSLFLQDNFITSGSRDDYIKPRNDPQSKTKVSFAEPLQETPLPTREEKQKVCNRETLVSVASIS